MRTTPPPPYNVEELFPELKGQAKTTVRLHPRRGLETGISESKMGGLFLWPADEPWPVCTELEASLKFKGLLLPNDSARFIDKDDPEHNDAFIGVLQLRAEDFPEMIFPEEKDLFQLLWCPRDHLNEYCPFSKVYWRKEEDTVNPADKVFLPKNPDKNYLPQPCYLNPERVLEYPSGFELPEEFFFKRIDAWQETQDDALYEYEMSVAPGTKIGGYVAWIQGAYEVECKQGHIMEHLLTIASWEFQGISYTRWLAIEDQTIINASAEKWHIVRQPSAIMLGDAGSLYLFICRQCEAWPIDWVFQCS
jgi:uncharacterized protein YwqG